MSKSVLIAACLLLAFGSSREALAQQAANAPSRLNLPEESVVNWVQPDSQPNATNETSTVKRSGFDPVMETDHLEVEDAPVPDRTPESADESAVSASKRAFPTRGNRYRYKIPTDQRAGSARSISKLAQASPNPRYQLGYVGGGSTLTGESRKADQGVFGMDYAGLNPFRTVWLKWNNGERNQSGSGAYRTDGRKILGH